MSEATDKARRLGWRRIEAGVYNPELDPHAFGERCRCVTNDHGICPCNCHGNGGTVWLDKKQWSVR